MSAANTKHPELAKLSTEAMLVSEPTTDQVLEQMPDTHTPQGVADAVGPSLQRSKQTKPWT